MTLAIFDLDNTLLAGDSDYLWGQYLVEHHIVDGEEYEREKLSYVRAGHWGGDRIMFDQIFRGIEANPQLNQQSDVRDGAFSVLVGFAARKSIDEGRPVRIDELTDLEPQKQRMRA